MADSVMPLDPQYIDQIKGFEGFRDTPYWDVNAYRSGYGTPAASADEKIDRATAETRLHEQLAPAIAHVDSIAPNAPPGARAALVDLTYNAGPGWAKSGLGDLVRAGDWSGAAERIKQYNKSAGVENEGLTARRNATSQWFGNQPQQPQAAPQQTASLAPPISLAPPPQAMPAMMPPQQAPIFPTSAPQQPQPQQTDGGDTSLFGQMPAEQGGSQPPPIFAPPRKSIDLSRLKAALAASGNRGFIFSGRG